MRKSTRNAVFYLSFNALFILHNYLFFKPLFLEAILFTLLFFLPIQITVLVLSRKYENQVNKHNATKKELDTLAQQAINQAKLEKNIVK